jgi:hypothetical protein
MKFVCRECNKTCIIKVKPVEELPEFCPFMPHLEAARLGKPKFKRMKKMKWWVDES